MRLEALRGSQRRVVRIVGMVGLALDETRFLFSAVPLILGRKYVRFMIFRFLSSIPHPNMCLVIVSN